MRGAWLLVSVGCTLSFGCASMTTETIAEPDPAPIVSRESVAANGELIVFRRGTDSAVARTFEERDLPRIREVAREERVELREFTIDDRAPAEIGITPLLVFQDHRGRAIYQGRLSTPDRLRNFVRTSRATVQGDEPFVRDGVFVRREGRSTVAAAIKVTELSGAVPEGYDPEKFRAESRRFLATGFAELKAVDRVALSRSDRSFYLDFHPYRSEDGTFYLSGALFSQFDCHRPVFEAFDPPERSSWEDRADAWRAMGQRLEAGLLSTLASARTGDGFDAVPGRIAIASWTSLGLELPPPPVQSEPNPATAELATSWTLATPAESEPPRLLFHFAPPVDHYAGEARRMTASLVFDEARRYASLRGTVSVDVASVTMGDPYLDASLQAVDVLDGATHPESTFVIERAHGETESLTFGTGLPVRLEGQFTMKGRTIPLTALATFEPWIAENGEVQLVAEGGFELRLEKPFGISGPDGPSPAKDTLRFRFRFRFVPDRESD
ncbi:MAG: YceI family protein [Planctomycetes bacterium]|nr:YceI family protein [Planctomycetota bacterium]